MRAAQALTNASVSASRAMWRGTLHGVDVDLVDDHGASWRTATPLKGRIVSCMFGRHLKSFRSGRLLQSEGERASALSHVCKDPSVHYAGSILPEPAADNILPKGSLASLGGWLAEHTACEDLHLRSSRLLVGNGPLLRGRLGRFDVRPPVGRSGERQQDHPLHRPGAERPGGDGVCADRPMPCEPSVDQKTS